MATLRAETRALHEQLMGLPYFAALTSREGELTSYVGHLRAMAIVHGAMDRELPRLADHAVVSVWRPELAATELLKRDHAFFRARHIPDIPRALDEALAVVANIRRRRVEDPASLLGYLYVLEGSRLGAPTLRALVARAFDPEELGELAYLTGEGGDEARWASFCARMIAVVDDEAVEARVVAAAREAFAGLVAMFGALHPVGETRFTIAAINPEAGAHAVPQDPREMSAALRVGDACWDEHPYLALRYGARGLRFTHSDSAWLATLATHEPSVIREQVTWLGGLLAVRGMPRLLLQRHLERLEEELSRAVPPRRASFAKLGVAARELADARDTAISRERAAALATEFEVAVAGVAEAQRIPRAGELLVAAVQDERAGVFGAVASVEGWLVDPSRFPAAWIAAVHATLAAARALT
jgi:heme oxygenase